MKSAHSHQRLTSAYFSEEESGPTHSVCESATATNVITKSSANFLTHKKNTPATLFPNHRAVLWNRSTYGGAIVLSPATMIASLRIPPQSVGTLIEQLCSVEKGQVHSDPMLLGQMLSTTELSQGEKKSLEHRCPRFALAEHFVVSLCSDSEQDQLQSEL